MLLAFTTHCDCGECQRHRLSLFNHAAHWNSGVYSYPETYDAFHTSNSDTPLCTGGCDTHGECSAFGMVCLYCAKCDALCECEKCSDCENLAEHCTCDSDECGDCGGCSCGECGGCSCGESDSDGMFGSIRVAPWVQRGLEVEPVHSGSATDARERWGIEKLDLCRAAADKYLLDGIAGGVANGAPEDDAYLRLLRSEAKLALSDLMARLDRTFRGYLDMIIGGELRHHRMAGSTNLGNTGRKEAWNEWRAIRRAGGTQVLRDAVELFRDFNSSSYGGEAWAKIAETLLDRETGRLSPVLFVEKVWMLQHNGGSLFDKGSWAVDNRLGWHFGFLNSWVLPAHGAEKNPWTVLLAVASAEVVELFEEYWKHANRVRRSWGERAVAFPERLPMRNGYYDALEPDWERASQAGMIGIVHHAMA